MYRRFWLPFAAVTFLFGSHPLVAQHLPPGIVVDSWTTADGLPVNGLTSLARTPDGYLWIGTWDGLARFDGASFSVFNRSNTPKLPNNRIAQLATSPDGILWIRTEHSQLAAYFKGQIREIGSESGLLGDQVSGLFTGKGGTLLAATDAGLFRWTSDGFENIWRTPPGTVGATPSRVVETLDGTLWIGTQAHGVIRVSGGITHAITSHRGVPLAAVSGMVSDSSGRVWVSSTPWQSVPQGRIEAGLYLVDGDSLLAQDPAAASWPVVWEGDDRQIRTEGGVYFQGYLDAGTHSPPWRLMEPRQEGRSFVSWDVMIDAAGRVTHWLERPYDLLWDQDNSLWVATNGQGLLRHRRVPFETFGIAEGLPVQNFYPVLVDRTGRAWTAPQGENGAVIFDPKRPAHAERFLTGLGVLTLYQDRQGAVFLGTHVGLCRISPQKILSAGRIHESDCEWMSPPGQRTGRVFAVHNDRSGRYWVAGDGQLWSYHEGAWQSHDEWLAARPENPPGAASPVAIRVRQTLPLRHRIRAIEEDVRGVVWFGAALGGLIGYAPPDQSNGFEGASYRITKADGLPSDAIRDLHLDDEGYLWVVTEDAGLARVDVRSADRPDRAPIARIQAADGLPDDALHAMLSDRSGRLWVSSNRGLFWIDRRDLNAYADGTAREFRVALYTERDGLRDKEFNGGYSNGGALDPSGALWFASQVGLVRLDPANIRPEAEPPVVVERVGYDGSQRAVSDTLRLQAKQRTFEIHYTAISLSAPDDLRFRYRLNGYQDEWVIAGIRRTAFYTQVPAGEYTFEVSARSKGGTWGTPVAVPVEIRPYFRETWWFVMLLAAALGGLATAAYRWRVGRLHATQRQLERLVDARTHEIVEQKNRTEQALLTVAAQAEELRSLDAAKSRFFANVSHEFRTPLTLILGPLEQLIQDEKLPSDARSSLRLVRRNGHRLHNLINQLLDLARLDAGTIRLNPLPHDLVEFLRQCISLFESLAVLRNITLRFEPASTSLAALFDAEKMERVMLNLLSNAVKFTPEDGTVTVRVAAAGEDIIVEVSDTGIGIPEADLPRVFDRFFQVDDGVARKREGSGIGLSLASELVALHGGSLTVRSTLGEGSTFIVAMPALAGPSVEAVPTALTANQEESGPEVPASNGGVQSGRPQVLVVEDNPDLRAYVLSHLSEDFDLLEAANGRAGLDLAIRWVPDLVISDVMMPEMDGLELCQLLKTDDRTSHIPVVLLTARDDESSRLEGLGAGADDYLAKPFRPEELRVRCQNLIAQRRLLRKRFSGTVLVLGADEVSLPSREAAFLDRLKEAIQTNMADARFGVDGLADHLGMSRSQLERKLHALLGESPGSLIKRIRLERAAQLLQARDAQVKQVAAAVGYRSVPYFSEAFRDMFGVSPSEFAAEAP